MDRDKLDPKGLEVWKPVVGYEGRYEVSNLGCVRRADTGRVLRQHRTGTKRQYPCLGLRCPPAPARTVTVHRLVCEAFHGPRPGPKYEVCHNDGNPQNNKAANLRWDTRKANVADAIEHGTWVHAEKVGSAKLTNAQVIELRRLAASGVLRRELAQRYGIGRHAVREIIIGRAWRAILPGSPPGESIHRERLTAEQVDAIRQSRLRSGALAAQYGVNRRTIQRIRYGNAWAPRAAAAEGE